GAVCSRGLLSCDCVWSDRLGTLGPQFDEAEQNLVPGCLELLDAARADLGMDAVDELLLHLGRQYREPSVFHQAVIGPLNCWKKCSMPPGPPPRWLSIMLPITPQRRPGPQERAVSTSAALTTPSATR